MRKILVLLASWLSFLGPPCLAKAPPSPAQAILLADQADRDSKAADWNKRKVDWPAVHIRDAARRASMMGLVLHGQIRTAGDYYSAAVIFQHGSGADDIQLAHAFAVIAMTLDATVANYRYMAAATWDRYLQQKGRPQWYGTQYVRVGDGRWALYPVDESAVDDNARRKMSVQSLDEARAEIAKLNGGP